jgi:FtsZ-binding cell division protein ZapB
VAENAGNTVENLQKEVQRLKSHLRSISNNQMDINHKSKSDLNFEDNQINYHKTKAAQNTENEFIL